MAIVSLLVVIVALIFMMVLSGGPSLLVFLDIPSLILLIVIVFPIIICSGMGKDFVNAFKIATKKKETTLVGINRAIESIKLAKRVMIYGSLLEVVFSFVSIVNGISGSDDLAVMLLHNLAVAVLPLLYAFAICIVLVTVEGVLNRKKIDYME